MDENEYDREMENVFNEQFGSSPSGMPDNSDEMSEMRDYVNRIGSFFRPVNAVDPQTSAVHYNMSPYAYVLNNPVLYRDFMGLDTTKTTQLPTVTVEANRETNGPPHWLGPTMILLGQPWIPKRFVTPGSSPGTSVASTVLNKALPFKSPKPLPSVVINRSGTRIVFTTSVGKFFGRGIPIAGWLLTAYDFTKEVAIPMSQGAADYRKANQKSGNWISNLPH